MGEYVERLWAPEDAGGLSRKDRAAGRYLAYVPDELGDRLPTLGAAAQGAAEDALAVLARADERIGEGGRHLNHLLIRSESISSSWIEGNRISPKRLAIAELLHEGPQQALDVGGDGRAAEGAIAGLLQEGRQQALDVVANVRATEAAIAELADRERAITTEDIVDLQHVIEPRLARGLRREQNWVGGPGWSPLRAAFVPPPEGEVERLVADLARFATDTAGNPVVRAAIVHAQFETIHPFIDGNGRTRRALIHTPLRRAAALSTPLLPTTPVSAGDTDSYIAGLPDYRADPPRLDEWVAGFAQAAERAAGNAVRLAEDIAALDARVRKELGPHRRPRDASPAVPRRDAVVLRILDTLASDPVLTAESVSTRLGVSPAAAHRAPPELAEAGILNRAKERGRLVCWTADRHLALVALTERSNRVGAEDTRNRRPARGPALPDLTRYGLGGASRTSCRDAPGLWRGAAGQRPMPSRSMPGACRLGWRVKSCSPSARRVRASAAARPASGGASVCAAASVTGRASSSASCRRSASACHWASSAWRRGLPVLSGLPNSRVRSKPRCRSCRSTARRCSCRACACLRVASADRGSTSACCSAAACAHTGTCSGVRGIEPHRCRARFSTSWR